MTMPVTATYIKSIGSHVETMDDLSDLHIAEAVRALDVDLPGTAPWIFANVPAVPSCECGSVHLDLSEFSGTDDPMLRNLVRLLATPFGLIVLRRIQLDQPNVTAVKFGWNGLERFAPTFMEAIEQTGARSVNATDISDENLARIVGAITVDMPLAVDMMRRSARNTQRTETAGIVPFSVSPQEDGSKERWRERVFQLMFAWSTPLKKYLSEWLAREYEVRGLAINCCMFPTEDIKRTGLSGMKPLEGGQTEQVSQQITPDC